MNQPFGAQLAKLSDLERELIDEIAGSG